MGHKPNKRVWITWETQRRSISLSQRLGAEIFVFDERRKGFLRYAVAGFKSLKVLSKHRGQVVFVQNPSIVLATLACLLKPIFHYVLIVDRHSNFLIDRSPPYTFKQKLFLWLSRFTVRKADLTIITNLPLLERVENEGGRGFILQDPYPDLLRHDGYRRNTPLEILFVSSWSDDEPIPEIVDVARILRNEIRVYISGRMKNDYADIVKNRPDNLILTGFIPDEEYFALMSRVDCVMAVTKVPYILVCGAYEGIAMGKPLILGNSPELRSYFSMGAVYTTGTVADLVDKIRAMNAHLERFRDEIARFYERSKVEWEEKLFRLNQLIDSLSDECPPHQAEERS